MSERYFKLFALSENLYSVGAPVVIAAGALQKDNQTGKVFAQLKIRNIQDKSIKAATVKITPFDTVGKPLGGTVDYQYLDLSAERDADFGQKTPVMLNDAATRSFAVSVSEVIFSDNSIWTAPGGAWEPLSPPVTPEEAFSDGELAKQYRVKYGTDCKCVFKKERDLWRCACGAINHSSERNCHSCQRDAAALAALDVEELKAERDRRLAAEQEKAAEEKAAAEKQAKKTKKMVMIAVPIVVVAIVAAVLISNFVKAQQEEAARLEAYNAAVALVEEKQYDEAIAAFAELGDYKDSTEQINETIYDEALALMSYAKTGSSGGLSLISEPGTAFPDTANFSRLYYNKAQSLLENIGIYKDSQKLLTEISYRKGMTESIADTCERLKTSTDDGEYVRELLEICEVYTPYCGELVGYDEDYQLTLISDFQWYNGEVVWMPEMPDNSVLGLTYGSNTYYFFKDGVYSLNSSMEATDECRSMDCIGIATLKNGSINIIVKEVDGSSTYYDINYRKVG